VADDGQPRFNVVKTYAFDDWGIYGRGDELLCRALARHPAVGQVFHVQRPADPASFRERFQAPVWDADVEGQIRRFKGVDDGGVHLYTPTESPGRPDGALDRTVAMLEREQGFARPMVLLQSLAHPFGADLARRLGGRGVTRVALARRDLRVVLEPGSEEHTVVSELYDTQVRAADLVWAATKELRDELRQRNPRTVLYPVGADPDLAGGSPAVDLADLPRPLVIYAGSMRASLDIALIRGTAERLGDHSFVFVGPHGDYLAPLLTGIKNIHVIGPRPYRLLADYLAAADVAIAPHQVVPATKAVVPEKLYGYLAAGLPVVTTAVAGVEELRRLLWTARDPGEFARAIQGAHKRDRDRRRGLRQAAVAPLTWDAIAAHLVASVDAVRRDAEPPAPPEPKVTVFPGFLAR
jgi:glycosyltransferase involved in cell wall biosynthesis